MTDLKPCPFCGDRRLLFEKHQDSQNWIEVCFACCKCGTRFRLYGADIDSVIALWNKRVDG